MISKWNYLPLSPEQDAIKKKLVRELSLSPVLCELLVQRGVTSITEAKKFFHPQLSDLHDPFIMNDMDKAVERLDRAMGGKEKILIYGDYDVDGTTAVALVYKFLRNFYSNIDYYIPDRYDEGYGISKKSIDFASENDFKLIIALDCGIKAIEKVAYAKSKGIDFIICDHHMPDEDLPDAVAVLDPKRTDSAYPYSHLSGCGVGFKFMQGFAINNDIEIKKYLYPLLDLMAVSIASDIVPITGENRILAYHGLKQLNTCPSLGLQSIIHLCGLKNRELTISDIVFKIGPRINASGRMQSGKEAVDLLISKDMEGAKAKSENINQYNEDRKKLDSQITNQANEIILKNCKDLDKRKSIVIYNADWHKGIIGIVASRLTELYYKPAVVLTYSNGLVTGSARSVQGFDIYKAIEYCRDLLENFGGHTYAAGLSLKEENIPHFINRFESYVSENILPTQMSPQLDIDINIEFNEITPSFFRTLKMFNPFGPGNTNPIFCTKNVYDYGTSRLVGRELEHLKLEMVDSRSENIMNGIAFGMHEYNDHIKSHKPFDICYTLEENTHNGASNMQLMIKEIRPSE
ncbi:single-stranded-DNA-specific exonuclease RecJ [Coprobacter tertius]|uniref:Single-stranded-DNA-specific exonuclease RecJ n=1 Tax=Coprobacter tertius TaxID=2944915 RepID=A0ABT1MIK6_9BACT|nr:single-stranded-DNA-specific exonuclease RecJ [Coprobacter tertius]MCP9611696.1 single-stranded-DNA-specific exonuclease RecJ [Coprobacter tertius]